MRKVTCPNCGGWVLLPGSPCSIICLGCGLGWEAKKFEWLHLKYYLKTRRGGELDAHEQAEAEKSEAVRAGRDREVG